MSVPAVIQRTGGVLASNGTTHNIVVPSSPVAGRLLLEVVSFDGSPGISIAGSSAAGWQILLLNDAGTVADGTIIVLAKVAGATNNLTLSTNVGENNAHNSFEIDNWRGLSDIYITTSNGDSTNANPPLLTPTLGIADYLWIAATAIGGGAEMPTAPPSGFGNHLPRRSGTSSANASVSTAELAQTDATSIDPGPFTSGDRDWTCATIGIAGPSNVPTKKKGQFSSLFPGPF